MNDETQKVKQSSSNSETGRAAALAKPLPWVDRGGTRLLHFPGKAVLLAVLLASFFTAFHGCGRPGGAGTGARPEIWVWLDAGLLEPVPSLERVLIAVDSAAFVGATGVVLEVKTRTGESFVRNPAFPMAKDVVRGLRGPLVDAVRTRCREHGLRFALGDRVFYGGNLRLRRGLLFQGNTEWGLTRLEGSGLIEDLKNPTLTWARLCPAHPDVQKAELAYLKYLASLPGVSTVWLDGVGFPDLWSGFGPVARTRFESWLEAKVRSWPADVLRRAGKDDSLKAGPYLRQWLLWRALVVKEFVERAAQKVHEVSDSTRLGVLVGGWLPRSYLQACNWAPASYRWTSRWLLPDYGTTSFLPFVDQLGIGLFFPDLREKYAQKAFKARAKAEGFDPGWFSVEGCVKRVAAFGTGREQTVGVVHVRTWSDDLKRLKKALQLAGKFGSVLVLDASTLNEERCWHILRAD